MGRGMGRGGGNDGGVIAIKRYLITTVDGEKRKTEAHEEVLAAKYTTCALSGEPLGDHIVVDELGHLFNKDAIITMLLEKRVVPQYAHIRSLKAVQSVKVTRTKADGASSAAASSVQVLSVKPLFTCPVSGLEALGRYPFVVVRKCGCLVSQRAVREVGGDDNSPTCPSCGEARMAGEGGLIRVAPSEEELEGIRARLAAKMAADKASKATKAGGSSAEAASSSAAGASSSAAAGPEAGAGAPSAGSKRPRSDDDTVSGAASSVAKASAGAGAGRVHAGSSGPHGGPSQGASAQEPAAKRPAGAAGAAQRRVDVNAAVSAAIRGSAPVSAAVDASVAAAKQSSHAFASLFHSGEGPGLSNPAAFASAKGSQR